MTKTLKRHPSLTLSRVMNADMRQKLTLANPGFCLACGQEQEGCEPDARAIPCEHCGEPQVMGASDLLMEITLG
jgi:hypothetical protein